MGSNGSDNRRVWETVTAHWFEDLPENEQLSLYWRWLVAGCGTATFILANMLLQFSEVLSTDAALVSGYLLISVGLTVGLGFLLAWKRKKTGPVRLFLSGIALPSVVMLAVRSSTSIGV